MRYQVPQFIEVEDKIIGPFSWKQFVYLIGGGGVSFAIYKILPLYIGVFLIIPIVALSLALAFYKVNNRPFIDIMESAFRYAFGSKLYLWKKTEKSPDAVTKAQEQHELDMLTSNVYMPKLADNKIKDISWGLNANKTVYSSEEGKMVHGASMNPNAASENANLQK